MIDYTLLVSILNLIVLVCIAVWGIRQVYTQAALTRKQHIEEVALSQDLEMLNRARLLLAEYHTASTKYYRAMELRNLDFTQIIELEIASRLAAGELAAISQAINDLEFIELVGELGKQATREANFIQVGQTSDEANGFMVNPELFVKINLRIFHLIKQRTVAKHSLS